MIIISSQPYKSTQRQFFDLLEEIAEERRAEAEAEQAERQAALDRDDEARAMGVAFLASVMGYDVPGETDGASDEESGASEIDTRLSSIESEIAQLKSQLGERWS